MPAPKPIIDEPRIGAMHPDELRGAMATAGYRRQVDYAAALGISQATLSDWLRGKQPIPKWAPRAVAGLRFYRPATTAPVAKRRAIPRKSNRSKR